MKTKNILLIILLIFSNVLLSAQNIKNGVYINGRQYICVNNDTIIRYDGLFWYKGTFMIKNKKMFFNNNDLLGKNATITKEQCGSDTIEFKLTTKTKRYVFGEPDCDTNIYDIETPLYTIAIGDTVFHAKNSKGIMITKNQLSPDKLYHGIWVYDEGSLSGFQDFFDIPIEYGTCYIIKQKNHDFRPSLISYEYKDSCEIRYDKHHRQLLLNDDFRADIPHTPLQYISPNCDSCFNELKNRFPELFE